MGKSDPRGPYPDLMKTPLLYSVHPGELPAEPQRCEGEPLPTDEVHR